jgi:TPR repeat protein
MAKTHNLPTPAQIADLKEGLADCDKGIYAKTLQEFKLRAKQGNVDAQFSLGAMYDIGQGVAQNDRVALKWYRLAAKQGDANAK